MGKKELIDKIMNATVAAAAKEIGSKMDNKNIMQAAKALIKQEDEAKMLWAAKGKLCGYNGVANGIAISEGGNKALIVRCVAFIDRDIKKGIIDICGVPVIKTPDGAETKSPFDSLEEKLKGPIMSIPLLRNFNLHKRYINIDIGEFHFTEAWSLSLAIIMSLVNAIYGLDEDPYTVYSANVISNGMLEPVGMINKKVIAAKKLGVKHFVLSTKNKHPILKELKTIPGFIMEYTNINEIFADMNLEQQNTIVTSVADMEDKIPKNLNKLLEILVAEQRFDRNTLAGVINRIIASGYIIKKK